MEGSVVAIIDTHELIVTFSNITTSSVIIYGISDPDTILFTQSYSPAYSVQADLTSLPAGNYVVDIYAFGCWWTGEFVYPE